MVKCRNFREWQILAAEADRLMGVDKWRKDNRSRDYDYKLISARLEHLQSVPTDDDEITSTMFFLRAG